MTKKNRTTTLSNHKGRNTEITMNESKQWKYIGPGLGQALTKKWQDLTLMRSKYFPSVFRSP